MSIYISIYMFSSLIVITRSNFMARGDLPFRPLIASILSICIDMICCFSTGGILSHCSNRLLYVPTDMADMCLQNGVLHTDECIRFRYHTPDTTSSLAVQEMLHCRFSKKQKMCGHLIGKVRHMWPSHEISWLVLKEDFWHYTRYEWYRNIIFAV